MARSKTKRRLVDTLVSPLFLLLGWFELTLDQTVVLDFPGLDQQLLVDVKI